MKDHEKGRLSCIIHVGAQCHQKGAYKMEAGESETGKQRHTKRDKMTETDRERKREKKGGEESK